VQPLNDSIIVTAPTSTLLRVTQSNLPTPGGIQCQQTSALSSQSSWHRT